MPVREEDAGSRLAKAARRYAQAGRSSRLTGRPSAPGSEFPPNYFLKRRVWWVLVVLALLLPGLISLFF